MLSRAINDNKVPTTAIVVPSGGLDIADRCSKCAVPFATTSFTPPTLPRFELEDDREAQTPTTAAQFSIPQIFSRAGWPRNVRRCVATAVTLVSKRVSCNFCRLRPKVLKP
jgi:hypothetical protein